MRISRTLPAALAGLALLVGGCSGGATSSPGSPGASNPATASAMVATPSPLDPDAVMSQAIAEGAAWTSFHVKISLNATFTAGALKATGDPAFANLTSDVAIDGMVIEGDLDPQNLTAHLAMTVPAIPALNSTVISGDLIVANSTLYLKLSTLGAEYRHVGLSAAAKDLFGPVPIPTPGGSSLVGLTNDVASLRQTLETDGVTPTLVGTDQIGGKPAYHIALSVPLDKLNSALAAAQASAKLIKTEPIAVDSASADIWIYQDTYELAQVQMTGVSSLGGNFSFTMTLTNFGESVTITPPAASQIGGGL